jgi:uncharacterized protein
MVRRSPWSDPNSEEQSRKPEGRRREQHNLICAISIYGHPRRAGINPAANSYQLDYRIDIVNTLMYVNSMLIEYELQGIQFVWDSHKSDSNVQNRRISFDTACEAFFDPFLQSVEVEEVDEEFREAIMGMTVAWKLLYVVYTIRGEDKIRIISARPVTKSERIKYEEY